MACLHPMQMFVVQDLSTGVVSYKLSGNAVEPSYITLAKNRRLGNTAIIDVLNLPCRKCLGCKLDYARSWTDRMLLEYQDTKKAVFITLTYNDASLPVSDLGFMTLHKPDVQLFMKRLRRELEPLKIRFFLAGEYGGTTHRPHYHAILFGVDMTNFPDSRVLKYDNIGLPVYTSDALARIWSHGFVSLAPATYNTFAYVSRYMLKKQGPKSYQMRCNWEDYSYDGLIDKPTQLAVPEFNLMSRMPGIGIKYLESLDIDPAEEYNISVNTGKLRDPVRSMPIPEAFLRRLKSSDPQAFSDLKAKRRRAADDSLKAELKQVSQTYREYLQKKEDILKTRTKSITRKDDL